MNEWLLEAQLLQEELTEYRRYLHQIPELGMNTDLTSDFVMNSLKAAGYDPEYIGGTGITAVAGGVRPGKVILLRGDMDGLPIQEETDLPFRSVNGNMHACGHDFHTTMLLGAAILLKRHEHELDGTVKFMFQPGEETLQGAKLMVEDGILENPAVDAGIMFHVVTGYPMPAGLCVVPDGGPFTAASDRFEIEVVGKGGHGAMPESCVDPIHVAAHIYIALQTIRSREIAGGEDTVITVGQIEGGTANNVIPDTVTMKGTIRTFNEETRQFIFNRIREIADGVASSFRAQAKVTISEGCPSVVNDETVVWDLRDILIHTIGEESVPDFQEFGIKKVNGSEDFSFVSSRVPSAMMILTAGDSQAGYIHPLHHPKAEFDESVLYKGAAAYALAAAGWLMKNRESE